MVETTESDVKPLVSRIDRWPGLCSDAVSRRQAFFSDNRQDVRDRVLELVRDLNIKTLSYDIFDTFLLRNDKSEARRYLELSEHLAEKQKASRAKGPKPSAESFLVARARAMQLAYRTAPRFGQFGEGNLVDVHNAMADMLDLSGRRKALLEDVEIEYESSNLTLNQGLADAAKAAREEGVEVIFITDMYMPAYLVEKLLSAIDGASGHHSHLFSSADLGHSKRSGTIYDVVSQRLERPPESFLHIGDSVRSDVRNAREAGWNALHLPILPVETMRRRSDFRTVLKDLEERNINPSGWAQV